VCDEAVPVNGASVATSQISMTKVIKVFGNVGRSDVSRSSC
jgi:hypothetical protein